MAKRKNRGNEMRDKPDRNTINLSGIPKATKAKKALEDARNRSNTK